MTTREQTIRLRVDQIVDRLGQPIDAGIKELVVALNLHHLPTSQSCQGHLDYGHPYPWVEVYLDEPEGWEDNEDIKKAWTADHLALQARAINLLTDYYQRHPAPYKDIFVLAPFGIYGAFRLQPISGPLIPTLPARQQAKALHHYQSQANHLAHHLLALKPNPANS